MSIKELKNEPLGDNLAIRARLMTLGWPSLVAWSKAYGYKQPTVVIVMKTWGLRTDRAPHGGISRAIVRDLRATMTKGIGPNDLKKQGVAVDGSSEAAPTFAAKDGADHGA